MNDSLFRDLGVLRHFTSRWGKGNDLTRAVWPVGTSSLAGTDLTHTMVVRPKPPFVIDHPYNIEDLYQALLQPDVRLASDKEVTFHHFKSDGRMAIHWPGGSKQLTALDVTPPSLPQGAPYHRAGEISIPTDALEYVARAMCDEQVRFALCGILIDGENRKIVASDGKRLHFRRFSSEKKFPKLILAKEAVWALLAAQEREGNAPIEKIGLPEGVNIPNFSLTTGRFTLYTKPIEGHFPDYHAVIPSGLQAEARLDAEQWRDALKSFRAFFKANKPEKGKSSPARRVRLDFSRPGSLRLVAMSDKSEASRFVRVLTEGTHLPLMNGTSYNGDYLLEASWNDKELMLQSEGPEKAIMIDGQAIVMPLSLEGGFEVEAKAYARQLKEKGIQILQPNKRPDQVSTWRRKRPQPSQKEEVVEPKPKPVVVQKPIPRAPQPKRPVRTAAPKAAPVAKRAAVAVAAKPKASPKKLREYDFPLFS